MENKIILLDFDGIYKEQNFYQGQDVCWINAENLDGTNSYCDTYAQKKIKQRLSNIAPPNISFLGSGNYHYATALLTQKISRDYCLVLFDNHSDMQKPMFDELLSCGGWLRTAMQSQPHLKQVALVGTCSRSLHLADKSFGNKVITFPANTIDNCDKWYINLSKEIHYPIYISVDKDVFDEDIAKTNWDQGDLQKGDFMNAFKSITKTHHVIGMDVCGECSITNKGSSLFHEANKKNNFANYRLMELAQRVIA